MFTVKDCALIAIATGRKARSLEELLGHLASVEAESVYHHFWGRLLLARFEEREYYNDFAAWAAHGLHDARLAERLAVVDPVQHRDFEELRRQVVEIIEERLDEDDGLRWARASEQLELLRSQIVVFDTGRRIGRPEELLEVVPHLSAGSVFYHFVDARRRSETGADDFSAWLEGLNGSHDPLRERLRGIDPYFGTLTELRQRLVDVVTEGLGDELP